MPNMPLSFVVTCEMVMPLPCCAVSPVLALSCITTFSIRLLLAVNRTIPMSMNAVA